MSLLITIVTLLKMGSLGNSFVSVPSAVTDKTSQGYLNFLKGVPLLPEDALLLP